MVAMAGFLMENDAWPVASREGTLGRSTRTPMRWAARGPCRTMRSGKTLSRAGARDEKGGGDARRGVVPAGTGLPGVGLIGAAWLAQTTTKAKKGKDALGMWVRQTMTVPSKLEAGPATMPGQLARTAEASVGRKKTRWIAVEGYRGEKGGMCQYRGRSRSKRTCLDLLDYCSA